MILVELSRTETEFAIYLGRRRQAENVARGLHHKYGFKGDGLAEHLLGAACEIAAARGLDLQWCDTARGDPDLADDIEVRGASRHGYRLILHRDDVRDPPTSRFVLVTKRRGDPIFRLVGWLWGAEGKVEHFWQDPGTGRPAFFVPELGDPGSPLRPIETLFLPRQRDRYSPSDLFPVAHAIAAE